MKIKYTNQIRFLLERTQVLMDVFYDNSKGLSHALKYAKVEAYKSFPNADGTEKLEKMPPFFNEDEEVKNKAYELIYGDRRGTLGELPPCP